MAGPVKNFAPLASKAQPAVVAAFYNSMTGTPFVLVAADGDTQNLKAGNLSLRYPSDKQGDKALLASEQVTGVRPGMLNGDFQLFYNDAKGRPSTLTHVASQNIYQLEGLDNAGRPSLVQLERIKSAAEFGGAYPNEKTEKLNRIPVTLAVGLDQAGIRHGLTCDPRTEYRAQLNCPTPGKN